MKRVSFIDLGSNSVRFVIIEINENGSYQLIYQQKESIRLSENMWEKNKLTEEAMERAIMTLKAFAHMAEAMDSLEIYAVATAAVRLAKNGNEFLTLVKERTGIDLECIDGTEEAYLGFLGVVNTIGLRDFILFDLGGASIEVTLVKDRAVKHSVSLPMGALTLTGKFQSGDEMSEKERKNLISHIQDVLSKEKWLKDKQLPLVGIGGTVRNLAKIDQRAHNYPIEKLHNYELSFERLDAIYEDVCTRTLEQRRKISGLSFERADIIVAGTALIRELMLFVDANTIRVSGCGLRDGLFYRYYGRNYMNEDGIVDDILLHSAENVLLNMVQGDLIHAKYITNLAKMLYDQWDKVYQWGPRMRELLQVSSLLHDIGKTINYYGHARHSAYLIVNSSLYGLSHKEQAICAFVAANSHGTNSKFIKASPYGHLLTADDRAMIAQVSLVLALAEAIDESHEQSAVLVNTEFTDKTINMTVWKKPGGNTSIAEVVIGKLIKQCKKDFRKNLIVEWREAL